MKTPVKPLLVFDTVQDMYKTLGLTLDTLDPKAEFSIHNLATLGIPAGYQSPVYRANFFSFVFFKDAWGKCSSDASPFETKPGTVYFNNPGHIKQFSIDEARELYLITLSEAFLKENVNAQIFDEFPFLLCEVVPPQMLTPEQFSQFEELYHMIDKAYQCKSPYQNKLIGHLFVALLIRIKECFWKNYSTATENDRASEICRKFKLLLEKHYRELGNGTVEKVFRVMEYADALHLHPNYLNTVIKSKTGKSIGTWIAEKTIAEAKSLLKNSAISVKEISYRLGFSEIQHFTAYFKKRTQSSPVVYRKSA